MNFKMKFKLHGTLLFLFIKQIQIKMERKENKIKITSYTDGKIILYSIIDFVQMVNQR